MDYFYFHEKIIFLSEEAAEGGFTAKAPGESIFIEGDTLKEIKSNIKEAIECHFEEEEIPKPIRLHIVKDELMIL